MTWNQFKHRFSVERGVIALLIFYLVLTLIQLERVADIADPRVRNWALFFMVARLAIVFVIAGIAVSALSVNQTGGKR